MTQLASPRAYRVVRIVPLTEWAYRSGIVTTAFIILTQVFLYVVMWRSLYENTSRVARLDVDQAITYSSLATLIGTTKVILAGRSRESVPNKIRDGSILFWFTRPLSPRRYCAWRGVGETLYSTSWTLTGLAIGVGFGIISLPNSPYAIFSVVSYAVGQVVLYYLALIIDLTGFWTLTTYGVTRLYAFAQALLSGALIPIWFFPPWFRTVSLHLPFAAGINTPVSIYVGRLRPEAVWSALLEQLLWCVILYALSRFVWWRAARRLVVAGG